MPASSLAKSRTRPAPREEPAGIIALIVTNGWPVYTIALGASAIVS
jgi:hypothetical protein